MCCLHILALHSKSKDGGVTYSCNIITGGILKNIIPEKCSLTVDVRFPFQKDLLEVEETISNIVNTSFIEGTTASYSCISMRPPMEKMQKTEVLFSKLLSVCKKYGLGKLTPVESGGGSDSCYTQMIGVTSICGMGACGAFCHTDKEYVDIGSIALRAKIIAAFLVEELPEESFGKER